MLNVAYYKNTASPLYNKRNFYMENKNDLEFLEPQKKKSSLEEKVYALDVKKR